MRYKIMAHIDTIDEEVLNYLSQKYIVTAENEYDEKNITYYVIKDTEPPPPPPPPPPPKKSILDILKKNE